MRSSSVQHSVARRRWTDGDLRSNASHSSANLRSGNVAAGREPTRLRQRDRFEEPIGASRKPQEDSPHHLATLHVQKHIIGPNPAQMRDLGHDVVEGDRHCRHDSERSSLVLKLEFARIVLTSPFGRWRRSAVRPFAVRPFAVSPMSGIGAVRAAGSAGANTATSTYAEGATSR